MDKFCPKCCMRMNSSGKCTQCKKCDGDDDCDTRLETIEEQIDLAHAEQNLMMSTYDQVKERMGITRRLISETELEIVRNRGDKDLRERHATLVEELQGHSTHLNELTQNVENGQHSLEKLKKARTNLQWRQAGYLLTEDGKGLKRNPQARIHSKLQSRTLIPTRKY